MDVKLLRDLARRYQENHEFITNEEMTKQSLIVPFIAGLGYDPSSPREVRLEYAAEFTANDGKRLPDRMDYAIFDSAGQTPILVIEAKTLGSDVRLRSPQLARYMSQLPQLRFGIITDGCEYLFYGDLAKPNVMDDSPFFSFSLADPKLDFESVAKFLGKFSKAQFKTEKLVADAEDSNYRQQMIEKLVAALRAPESDEQFVKWLSDGVYAGLRTRSVLERLSRIARESVQPAILRTISDDFLTQLRSRINEASKPAEPSDAVTPPASPAAPETVPSEEAAGGRTIVTTEEELDFYRKVRDVCVRAGEQEENVLYKDTLNYFNVSFCSPSRWFVRLFAGSSRKAVTTLVSVEEAKSLAQGFKVEDAPKAFGTSRVFIDSVDQAWALAGLIVRSLEVCKEEKGGGDEE
ncbi:MAG: type I restriction enzyme HsdR N-terminal domain-containing protein [Polyangiaceae bacterium]|nr:type I restriction enzyme HsdR N-terminal domain-containing protein [Polyangiaceae bacterium]